MTRQEKPKAVQCSKEIDGPLIAYNVVAWRKHCTRKTTHPSGRCWQHRKGAFLPTPTTSPANDMES